MKILHSADWHLDSPQPGLRQQLKSIPGKIAELSRREGCDLVLLSGDLFDGPYTRESLDAVRTALKESDSSVASLEGSRPSFTGT